MSYCIIRAAHSASPLLMGLEGCSPLFSLTQHKLAVLLGNTVLPPLPNTASCKINKNKKTLTKACKIKWPYIVCPVLLGCSLGLQPERSPREGSMGFRITNPTEQHGLDQFKAKTRLEQKLWCTMKAHRPHWSYGCLDASMAPTSTPYIPVGPPIKKTTQSPQWLHQITWSLWPLHRGTNSSSAIRPQKHHCVKFIPSYTEARLRKQALLVRIRGST